MNRYQQRRKNFLWRLVKMRQLGAPVLIVRHEQMLLWALRQTKDRNIAPVNLSGWAQNWDKFIRIHEEGGSA